MENQNIPNIKLKENKWKIISIILIILFILIVGYYVEQKYVKPYYQEQGVNNLINDMNNRNYFPIICSESNIIPLSISYNRSKHCGGSNP